jgi:outer membrane protein OmpA-like peptidoglycan-associated protein
MKYAAALLTFALASPALAQSGDFQSDPEQIKRLLCDLDGICDPAEQEIELAAAAGVDAGEAGPVKGLTLSAAAARAATNTATTRTRPSTAAPAPRARTIPPRRPIVPIVATVTEEVKGDSPLMVTFASNSSRLTRQSGKAVASFADYIRISDARGKGDRQYLIEGHTDTVGAADFNQELSQKRAQAVVDALVAEGFEADRFVVDGKGETATLEGRRGRDPLNRRVMAKVID